MKKWIKDFFNKKGYKDYYQIRKITLLDSTVKYYPEYRNNSLDNWSQLFLTDKGRSGYVILSTDSMTKDDLYYQNTEAQCLDVIEKYKASLADLRAKEFYSEDVIKVD